jgi:hypothetical protein
MRGPPALLMAVMWCVPALAQNETDWAAYFTYQDITFYYAPSTVERNGATRIVKWHDTRNPQVVFKSRIDCAARTITSISADEYDLITGEWYDTKDLSEHAQPDDLGTPASMGSHLAATVC